MRNALNLTWKILTLRLEALLRQQNEFRVFHFFLIVILIREKDFQFEQACRMQHRQGLHRRTRICASSIRVQDKLSSRLRPTTNAALDFHHRQHADK